MRFKVDENLPQGVCELLSGAGDDAISVGQQGLGGAADMRIRQPRQDERRAFVTLDVDFANLRACDPKSSSGVIVLRLARQDQQRVLDVMARTLPVWEREPLAKRLWVVEEDRIRIRAWSIAPSPSWARRAGFELRRPIAARARAVWTPQFHRVRQL